MKLSAPRLSLQNGAGWNCGLAKLDAEWDGAEDGSRRMRKLPAWQLLYQPT
jgi:hypothetical protein